ncbi:MAG: biotin/lipoyl-binding protein, partial [Dehalococcoidales bacterium]|nr:biotin/lipoyl-binding protein [Dehalococcoidales bacterium]
GGLTIAASSCSTAASTAAPKTQTVAVQRGNLTVDITGVGNLALSQKDDLAFEVPGTVAEVLVKEGDTVTRGQVLARLDTTDWDNQVSALVDKVTAAERQLTTKQRALTTAMLQPDIKKRNVEAKKRDVVQAELNLKDAQTTLDTTQITYTEADFIAAQAAIDAAQTEVDKAVLVLSKYDPGTEGYKIKRDLVISAQSKLKTAQAKLDDMLAGFDKEVATNKQLVDTAQWNLETAQIAVKDAQTALDNTQQDIEDARLAVKDTEKALADARKALADAKSKHPEITALYDGFITKVNVLGGDVVTKGTVAVTMADPNKFEADILVNETDIIKTRLGGNANVAVEAVPGLSLPAKVTAIAPTATISSGVVNFKVKVQLDSLQSVMQALQAAGSNLSSGNVTSPRQPAGGNPFSGNGTPRQPAGGSPFSGNGTSPGAIGSRQGGTRAALGQILTALPGNFQLREGQTVTVSILVAASNNVLLVPNSAITSQGGQSIVKVLNNGVVEQRSITVGISDYQYTEVSGELSEGETVVVPQNTAPGTTTTSQQGGQGAIRIPGAGMGGFAR